MGKVIDAQSTLPRHGFDVEAVGDPTRLMQLDDQELAAVWDRYGVRIERDGDGGVRILAPSGRESGRAEFGIVAALGAWVSRHGGEGYASSQGFRLSDTSVLSPDVAWISPEQVDSLGDEGLRGFIPLAPAFLCEVMSPTDSLPQAKAKMELWKSHGVRLGWLIHPAKRRVYVYRMGTNEVQTLDSPATLTGEDVLPGFEVDIARVCGWNEPA